MKNNVKKKGLILSILLVISSFVYFEGYNYLTFESLKAYKSVFSDYYAKNPSLTLSLYFLTYVIAVALSIPGATILTLAGGALFGVVTGSILVSLASTIGATLAFLACRFLLRDWVSEKFGNKLKPINDGVEKDGAFYLFSLRLVPIFPFFIINLTMGLTSIKTWKFFIVSQLGMLPGTVVYVNAGTQLGKLDSVKGILSPSLLISFSLLGIFPLVAKKIIDFVKGRKAAV